ncbi:MAG: hypothetical protein H8E25_17160 [Planctomycetes bacterium]|nr:hypothetical protein [Planctomycetota bacterium]
MKIRSKMWSRLFATFAALGLTYAVKGKTDLNALTWSATGITDEVEVTTLNDEFEAVTVTTPMDSDNKFLRLEIN